MNIGRPDKYKNWLIWNNTVYDNMHIVDCDDTIDGICLTDKTIEECIDICENKSSAGYYVRLKDDTICVPIKTDIHKDLNPIFRLRNQKEYPELRNVNISSFVNSKQFPFPPDMSNVIFYRDILTLQHVNTKNTLGKKGKKRIHGENIYIDDQNDNIQLLPATELISNEDKYIPVKFGDKIRISVPNTTLSAKESPHISDTLVWNIIDEFNDNMAFTITPISPVDKNGDLLKTTSVFALSYDIGRYVILKNDRLYLEYEDINNLSTDAYFTFISKMKGYYCDNGCKSIPISQIDINNAYQGKKVFRNNDCWGLCYKSTKSFTPFIILFFVCMISLVVFVITRIYKHKTN